MLLLNENSCHHITHHFVHISVPIIHLTNLLASLLTAIHFFIVLLSNKINSHSFLNQEIFIRIY